MRTLNPSALATVGAATAMVASAARTQESFLIFASPIVVARRENVSRGATFPEPARNFLEHLFSWIAPSFRRPARRNRSCRHCRAGSFSPIRKRTIMLLRWRIACGKPTLRLRPTAVLRSMRHFGVANAFGSECNLARANSLPVAVRCLRCRKLFRNRPAQVAGRHDRACTTGGVAGCHGSQTDRCGAKAAPSRQACADDRRSNQGGG